MPEYPKAPITEALINLKLERLANKKKVNKASIKIGRQYEKEERLVHASVTFQPNTGQHDAKMEDAGSKWISKDASDIVVIQPEGLTISRLAPYCGWNNLIDRFTRDWKIWNTALDAPYKCRIGVRYINRIDVPCPSEDRVRIEDYFNINIRTPNPDELFIEHGFSFLTRPNNANFLQRIQVSSIPAPIINHVSFIFDVDVWITGQFGSKSTTVDTLNEMRDLKNSAFETNLTAKAKELFS